MSNFKLPSLQSGSTIGDDNVYTNLPYARGSAQSPVRYTHTPTTHKNSFTQGRSGDSMLHAVGQKSLQQHIDTGYSYLKTSRSNTNYSLGHDFDVEVCEHKLNEEEHLRRNKHEELLNSHQLGANNSSSSKSSNDAENASSSNFDITTLNNHNTPTCSLYPVTSLYRRMTGVEFLPFSVRQELINNNNNKSDNPRKGLDDRNHGHDDDGDGDGDGDDDRSHSRGGGYTNNTNTSVSRGSPRRVTRRGVSVRSSRPVHSTHNNTHNEHDNMSSTVDHRGVNEDVDTTTTPTTTTTTTTTAIPTLMDTNKPTATTTTTTTTPNEVVNDSPDSEPEHTLNNSSSSSRSSSSDHDHDTHTAESDGIDSAAHSAHSHDETQSSVSVSVVPVQSSLTVDTALLSQPLVPLFSPASSPNARYAHVLFTNSSRTTNRSHSRNQHQHHHGDTQTHTSQTGSQSPLFAAHGRDVSGGSLSGSRGSQTHLHDDNTSSTTTTTTTTTTTSFLPLLTSSLSSASSDRVPAMGIHACSARETHSQVQWRKDQQLRQLKNECEPDDTRGTHRRYRSIFTSYHYTRLYGPKHYNHYGTLVGDGQFDLNQRHHTQRHKQLHSRSNSSRSSSNSNSVSNSSNSGKSVSVSSSGVLPTNALLLHPGHKGNLNDTHLANLGGGFKVK